MQSQGTRIVPVTSPAQAEALWNPSRHLASRPELLARVTNTRDAYEVDQVRSQVEVLTDRVDQLRIARRRQLAAARSRQGPIE
jgi:hypothetical protein